MWKRISLLGLLLVVAAPAKAQLWSGVLNSARGMTWANAGTTLPDGSWTQCGSTITASGGDDTTAIQNALTACTATHYVNLAAGTFNITGLLFPRNTTGQIELRGQGPNSTFINYTAGVGCNGSASAICISSSDSTFPGGGITSTNWTAGYAQGATQITLASVAGITLNKTLLVLNQCDTGFSGAACTTGSATDNGGYWVCSAAISGGTGCSASPDGSSWRANAFQMEIVQATAINAGGCGATCVTISQPLEHPNWSSGNNPIAVLIQPIPQDGVRNLSLDGTNAGTTDDCIGGQDTYELFIDSVRCVNTYKYGFFLLDSSHHLIQNNYLVGFNNGSGTPFGDRMGFRINFGADGLIQNNIVQNYKVSFVNDGPDPGSVFAYNFLIDNDNAGQETDFMWTGTYQHATGDDFQLFEGNEEAGFQNDNIHGTHLNQTYFRNFSWGWESCANGNCGSFSAKTNDTTGIISSSGTRYAAYVGNVLGLPTFHNIYLNMAVFGSNQIYQVGGGNAGDGIPDDPLAQSTSLFWANYDTVTAATRFCGNSSDTGWSTTCASTSEVPTTAPTFPNSVPTKGDTGIGQGALPNSFYLSSKPSWFGSVTWPPIGPDVTSGNVGQCAGTLNVTGKFNGLPATNSSQCAGSALNTAWAGHVNANPAMACAISMGIPPDGVSGPKAFTPSTCYAASSSPIASLSVTSHSYLVAVNGTASFAVTMTNTGSANLTITSVVLTGPASYSITANTCNGATVIPAGTCSVTVQFAPVTLPGGLTSATLTFTDNASPTTQTVTYNGNATFSSPGPPPVTIAFIDNDSVINKLDEEKEPSYATRYDSR